MQNGNSLLYVRITVSLFDQDFFESLKILLRLPRRTCLTEKIIDSAFRVWPWPIISFVAAAAEILLQKYERSNGLRRLILGASLLDSSALLPREASVRPPA